MFLSGSPLWWVIFSLYKLWKNIFLNCPSIYISSYIAQPDLESCLLYCENLKHFLICCAVVDVCSVSVFWQPRRSQCVFLKWGKINGPFHPSQFLWTCWMSHYEHLGSSSRLFSFSLRPIYMSIFHLGTPTRDQVMSMEIIKSKFHLYLLRWLLVFCFLSAWNVIFCNKDIQCAVSVLSQSAR